MFILLHTLISSLNRQTHLLPCEFTPTPRAILLPGTACSMVLAVLFLMEHISLASESNLVMALLYGMGRPLDPIIHVAVKTIDLGRFRHRKTLKCQTRVSVITPLLVLLLLMAIVAIINTTLSTFPHLIIRNHQGPKVSHRFFIIRSHKINLQARTGTNMVPAGKGHLDRPPLGPFLRGDVLPHHPCPLVVCINLHLLQVVTMVRMAPRRPHAMVMETSLIVPGLLASALVRLVVDHMGQLYLVPLTQTYTGEIEIDARMTLVMVHFHLLMHVPIGRLNMAIAIERHPVFESKKSHVKRMSVSHHPHLLEAANNHNNLLMPQEEE
jgi:hypothetical protein